MAIKKKVITSPSVSKVQNYFIDQLKLILPDNLVLAQEISDILEITLDSAYRRIRCETLLSIDEVFKISSKYNLNIDDVFSNTSNTVRFDYIKLTDSELNFENYLLSIMSHIKELNKYENRKLIYVAEEMPIFYSFSSQKLTEFKLFYWQRSVLNISKYQKIKFEWGLFSQKIIDAARNTYNHYLTVPSQEIWTTETLNASLKQIKYYFDTGLINKKIALELLVDYKEVVLKVQNNAEIGKKNINDINQTFKLYNCNVVLGTNCIYTIMGNLKHSFISFNTLNSLKTNNPEFCNETEHWIKNIQQKSTLISKINEKERHHFFSTILNLLEKYYQNFEST